MTDYRIRTVEYTDTSITVNNVKGNARPRTKLRFIIESKDADGAFRSTGIECNTREAAQRCINSRLANPYPAR